MSLSLETRTAAVPSSAWTGQHASRISLSPGYQVIRRNGGVTPFDATKITVALTKAFLAVEGNAAVVSRRVHDTVADLTDQIVATLARRADAGGQDAGRTFHVEEVQDQVELALMRGEHHKVARAYVLYRDERAKERAAKIAAAETAIVAPRLSMKAADGSMVALDFDRHRRSLHGSG
jgi:ribonucleoside-diphosphate reductase alpha chain